MCLLMGWPALGQTIVNPSFEDDTVPPYPGYSAISGWTTGAAGNVAGINDAAGPFADNGVIPAGQKVVFIQAATYIRQTVSGFTVGSEYRLSFRENARNCCGGVATLQVTVGGVAVVAEHPVNAVGGANPYVFVLSAPFTATTEALEISFLKSGTGDATVLIDDIALVPPNTPVTIMVQPRSQTVVEGDTVVFTVTATGSAPLTYQWFFNDIDLPGETNPTLTLANVRPDQLGNYWVDVANAEGTVTSAKAILTVRARVPGLFNTGVDDTGAALPDNSTDPHYVLLTNAHDTASSAAIVQDSTAFPIAVPAGPWLANDAGSKWIGPLFNTAGAAGLAQGNGTYVYRTTVNLTGQDLNSVIITGGWSSDNTGVSIRVNDVDTGLVNDGNFGILHSITINSANATFVDGVNTLDFVVQNADAVAGYTGLRVGNLRASAALPGSAPAIDTQPQSQILFEGDTALFNTLATGSAPLSYQWRKNDVDIADATTNRLTLVGVTRDDQGDYTLLVSNPWGAVTSAVARLIIFERIPTLFPTGVDDLGVPLADNSADAHYVLIANAHDPASSAAIVQDSTAWPIVAGPWLANSGTSKWIGPLFNTAAAAVGSYVYRLSFDLADRDPDTVVVVGGWAVDNTGTDIRVNGVSSGNPQSPGFGSYAAFSLASSNATFYTGVNTIDFVVENVSAVGPTGLRVENLKSDARLIPAGTAPYITVEPQGRAVRESEGFTLSARVKGSAPVVYQWFLDGLDLLNETNATLHIPYATALDAGQYTLVASNPHGLANSQPAQVTVIPALELGIGTHNALTIHGTVGRTYKVEYTDDPAGGTYTTLATFMLPSDPYLFVDPTANPPPQRAYRVVLQP
jgi:hypothetical protein